MRVRAELECVILEKYTVAPAPSRDYYGIKVSPSKVLMYHWKISRSRSLFPTVRRFELERFVSDPSLQDETEYIFGKEILLSIIDIANGNCDCFSVLPFSILIRVFSFLRLTDIAAVASTCKRLANMISTNDDLWMQLYKRDYRGRELSKEEKSQVRIWGWQRFFQNKFYLHNKISRLSSFSQFQDRKVTRPPHYNVANRKKELTYIARSGTTSRIIQNTEQQKNMMLSGQAHRVNDKKVVAGINKTIVATVSKLEPAPVSRRSTLSNSSTFPHNKSKSATLQKIDHSAAEPDGYFKHSSPSVNASKQETAVLTTFEPRAPLSLPVSLPLLMHAATMSQGWDLNICQLRQEEVFVGPDIRKFISDKDFHSSMTPTQNKAWVAFTVVKQNFLRNQKGPNHKKMGETMSKTFQKLGYSMSSKVHFFNSHFDYFFENLEAVSKK